MSINSVRSHKGEPGDYVIVVTARRCEASGRQVR
jgi:hypothetical protein